ncbi:MAG TPA: [protein-PII] uridylyltransferase [Acidimicrobiales bacterium]|nr:[protein-PII] uridylyltransferase [Acidimicrobiales bacterium]
MNTPAGLPGSAPLKELKAALLERRDLTGPAWCRQWAATADGWLEAVFGAACGGDSKGLALMAVGGYGRSALAPGSDLDLLLLHNGRNRRIKAVADAIWYPIWDSGQPLDHSVRTIKELRTAMDSDIKVGLGLLDARLIAGDPKLAEEAQLRAGDMWSGRTARWLRELEAAVQSRHERFGDLAFLLEPDLKEARGGLRDIQLLRTISKVASPLTDILNTRVLGWAESELTAIRVELQRPSGSAGNVLLLQDQDLVAAAMGMEDADVLMAAVSDAARAIAWASDDGWRRIESWLSGPKARASDGDLVLEPGIMLHRGEVTLADRADPAADLTLALRVAAASAERDQPISRSTLERLAHRSLAPEGVWPPAVLNALLRLLGAGRPAIGAIESLDQQGVWMRYLPEWSPVRNRPQRNAYHRYTVDRHLLEAVANASAFQSSVHRPDLLLLGTLLHYIGKGQGGDHTEIGIEIVSRLGPRLGLPPEDVAVLEKLVRLHLLLPDAATRRDLEDPATAASVAGAVGDRDTLELLAALTRADSLATGPAAWGAWKAGLVDRLVAQVEATLEGRPPPDNRGAELSAAERELLAHRQLSVTELPDGRVLVAAADQGGLLSTVAGVLTLAGVYVRAATTMSDEASGMALFRFEVSPAFDKLPDWQKVQSDLADAIAGRLEVGRLLEEREARYSRYQTSKTAYLPDARVIFDLESSPASTIVEVRAPDRGPVLYRVTRAIAACGVDITCALVSTLGAEAIDVFYVRSNEGGRVDDPATLSKLESAVLAAI